MKNIILIILGVLCTVKVQAQVIDTAFITQPILCFGQTGGMQINVNQSAPPTLYSFVTGYYSPGTSFFIAYGSTNQTTGNQINLSGFLGDIDYFIRIVDSTAYYNANPFGSGISLVGVFDELGPINFPQPTQLIATSLFTDITCSGLDDGTATVSPSEGTPYILGIPYSYLWSNGQTTQNITGLSAGTYICTITDSNLCSITESVTIVDSDSIIISLTGSNALCNGDLGIAGIGSLSGGVSPYTYLWDDPLAQTTPFSFDLLAGSYSCIVTDFNSCSGSAIITITEPSLLTAIISTNNVSCYGYNDGNATAIASGGTTPYTYLWSDGQATNSAAGLLQGTYSCTITDANGCDTVYSVVITEPPAISVSVITIPVSCNGGTDGSVILTINGGTGPYTVNAFGYSLLLMSNIFTTPMLIPAGSYPYTITDSLNCVFSNIVTITEPPAITSAIFDTACGEYLFASNLLDTSGTYLDTLVASNSCDSIVILELIIFEDSSVTYLPPACDSIEWNGVWYYSSDTITTTGLTTTNSFGAYSSPPAGKEGNIWYFGDHAGLDFNSGVPVPLNNGQINTIEGSASIADDNGDLLFYTDGSLVYNKNHTLMPNGTGLLGSGSSTQSAIIVKKPLSSNIYYLFTVNGTSGGGGGLNFSEVDMNLDGGLGNINSNKNIMLIASTSEKVTAITHQNESDFWIISRLENSDTYHSFLLSATSLNTIPVVSSIGAYHSGTGGYLKASKDGSRLAAVFCWSNVPIELYDFDNSTGILSNVVSISTSQYEYGVEFSPSGDILYTGSEATGGVYQYDLLAGSAVDIANSEILLGYTSGHALQTGPDGKIYAASWNDQYLSTIESPDILGVGCSFVADNVPVGGTSYAGLPSFFSSIFNSPPSGCDSVATVIITINNSTSSTDTQVHCDSYTWIDGVTYTSSNNTVTYMFQTVAGCDSLSTLDLTINYSTSSTDTQVHCDSYTWVDGVTYTSSNNAATFMFQTVDGCDSLSTLDLTINYSTSSTDTQVHCDSYIWVDGVTYTSSNNTATYMFQTAAGCDSLSTLDLAINNSTSSTDTQVHCDSYTWLDGVAYISSNNTATFMFQTVDGCDSLSTLDLTINNSTSSIDTQEHCDSYIWLDGVTYTSSNNTATFMFQTVDGCDSLSTLNLIINYSSSSTDTQEHCDSYTWLDGVTYTSSNNTATFMFQTLDGCDSLSTLDLIINQSTSSTDTQVHCNLYTWLDGVTYLASNNMATFMFQTVAGCDSLSTLDLTIRDSSSSTDTQVQCDTYTWVDGVTYTSSNNTATFMFQTVAGCDSLSTLDLTINYSSSSTDTQEYCDTYTWLDGVAYTVSNNTATMVYTNAVGCDSTVTLDLTIIYSSLDSTLVTACDYYDWLGNAYTSSGLYPFTYTNVAGCDSVHTLHLTINNSDTGTSSITSCDYYIWEGITITSSGNYFQIFTNVAGCDSTHILDATINYSDIVTDPVGSCDPYTWIDGITYTASNNTAVHTLTNIYGCDSIILLDLIIYQDINVSAVVQDELCIAYSDGSIVLSVSGGLGTFSYSWTGFNFTSILEDISGLIPGTYDLTITDNLTSCTKDTFFVVNAGFDIQINDTIINATCYGLADASIDITPINLISPVYNWSDINISIEDRANLAAGIYYLQIDDNNCFFQDTFIISQPDSLFLIAQQSSSLCDGDSSGQISVDVYGGTPTYSYFWSNFINTPVNSNLPSGVYTITVIDDNNCQLLDTFDITSYIVDIILLVDPPSCNGLADGSIDLEVLGGYPVYSFSWSNGSMTQDLDSLLAGSYTCEITDAIGCNIDTTIIVYEPDSLIAIPTINHITCYGENTGSVSLSILGGTPSYNLDWNNIDTNNLFAGIYFYEITDSNGCVKNDSIIVTQEDSLEVSFAITDVQCPFMSTGSIEVIIGLNTGTPPYYYVWDGPNFHEEGFGAEDISNLFAGIYQLTITDGNNCEHYVELVVDEPTQIDEYITMVSSSYSGFNISCKYGDDGWIEAQVSGGYLPYYFYWSTGYEGYDADSLTTLTAGEYTCVITDGIGCQITNITTIAEPQDSISVFSTVATDYNGYDISCYYSADGAIDLDVSGGTGVYTYNWSDFSLSSDSATGVSSGVYGVVVYDSNGCFDEDSITLNAPDELILDLIVSPDTCTRGVGAVDLLVNGGVPSFEYLWESGQITGNVSDLFFGDNNVIVTDANTCEVVVSVFIEDLEKPVPDFNTFPDHRRFYEQLDNPIVFIDMTECYWQSVSTWEWDFGDGTFGSDSLTSHVYNEQGEFDVLLTITTESNCIDTISRKVLIDEYDLFIPNAFTPGSSDDINTEFKSYGYGVVNYIMKIYTRWGERVFETEDLEKGWDGTHYLNGNDCIAGVYAYYIEVENIYGEIFKYENQVRLIR